MERKWVLGWWAALLSGVLNLTSSTFAGGPQAENGSTTALNGRPPLVEAVRNRDAARIGTLLALKVDPNARSADGSTALHWAADGGDPGIVGLLIGAGADVNAANRYGVRPLTLACENGQAAVIERLLNAGADPNASLLGGQTPLMTAARTGKVDAVKVLLAHGATVNAREETRGQTALMWAAAEGHVASVEALLQAGADITAKSHGPLLKEAAPGNAMSGARRTRLDSFTPILFAVQAGHLDVVRTLLDHGATVNETVPDGTSLLVLAIANAHYELASYLVDRGADVNAAGQGWNALVQVVRTRNPSLGQAPPLVPTGLVSSLELAKKLLDRGVDVNARIAKQIRDRYRTHLNMVGATAYLMAAKAADYEMMRLLLNRGADPLVKTVAGRTALMVAAGVDMFYIDEDSGTNEDAVEAVKVALEAGADVNAVGDDGETALHGGAFRGSNEIVQMLVDRGATLDVLNKRGFTPLMIANGDARISCNLQRRPWTVELLRKLMVERGLPALVRSDEEKFSDGVSRGYSAAPTPAKPNCRE